MEKMPTTLAREETRSCPASDAPASPSDQTARLTTPEGDKSAADRVPFPSVLRPRDDAGTPFAHPGQGGRLRHERHLIPKETGRPGWKLSRARDAAKGSCSPDRPV